MSFAINRSVHELRATLTGLRLGGQGIPVRTRAITLLRELQEALDLEVVADIRGPVGLVTSREVSDSLVAVIREAVTNVSRHARATHVMVSLSLIEERLLLRVIDDGERIPLRLGFHRQGFGVDNMRRRADELGGAFSIESPTAGGTVMTWMVPIDGVAEEPAS